MRPALPAALLVLLLPAGGALADTLACRAERICRGGDCTAAEGQGLDIASGNGLSVTTDLGPARVMGASEDGASFYIEVEDAAGAAGWITVRQADGSFTYSSGGMRLEGTCG